MIALDPIYLHVRFDALNGRCQGDVLCCGAGGGVRGDSLGGGAGVGRAGDSVGCRWGMLPNASRGIDLMSEWVVELVLTVVLRPTFPTHLVVHFANRSVEEVQVRLHHAAGLSSRVPENAFPLLKPCCLDLILNLVWSILLVLLDEDCHRKHIALGGDVPRATTGIADEAGIVLPSIQGRTNEAST
jgi:hypothetical protein